MRRLSRRQDVDPRAPAIPLGRYGSVKEIADATIYLFSDSGNYVNGSTVAGKSETPSFITPKICFCICRITCDLCIIQTLADPFGSHGVF